MNTTAEISGHMRAINAELPPNDGVALFNRTYLLSRENVLAAADDGYFSDRDYIYRLDRAFAPYWLRAYYLSKNSPLKVPACWKPTFSQRMDPQLLAVQHIVAGLTAHIFRDLSLAVFDTERWIDVPRNKLFVGKHFNDYNGVSDILVRTMDEQVLPEFRDTYSGEVLLGIDSLLAGFSIRLARVDAWDRGNTMRLKSPFGASAEGTVLDTAFSVEAGVLAQGFLTPPLADLL